MKRSKKYIQIKQKLSHKQFSLDQAIAQISALSLSKFNGKIELHASLNLNEKERKQAIRGSVVYKSPIGKAKRILVFADEANQDIAAKAGADYYGLEELINKIKEGWTDFDVAIATPNVMSKIAVLGRILGTKGLMPNPKSGTVSDNIQQAVASYKAGKIDFKADDSGVIHSIIGTQTTDPSELKTNLIALIKAIIQSAPKQEQILFKSIYLAPTMGPSIQLDLDSILKELSTK